MSYCACCNYFIPAVKEVSEKGIHLHRECARILKQEIRDNLLEIADAVKGVCAQSNRLRKSIRRKLRRDLLLSELIDFFKTISSWMRERARYFTEVAPANVLDVLYRTFNYLGRRLGLGDEIIAFPIS